MNKGPKEVECRDKDCKNTFMQYNSTQVYCCLKCKLKNQKEKKPKEIYSIPKVSKKRKVEQLQYSVLRTEFLAKPENSICFIEGCNKPATTIEHRAGRGINYLNVSTWAGCCLKHNLELENNPELSKKYQLSKITGKEKL